MTETQIRAALRAFEAESGIVSEAEGLVAEMQSGCSCIGCCDTYKCQYVD